MKAVRRSGRAVMQQSRKILSTSSKSKQTVREVEQFSMHGKDLKIFSLNMKSSNKIEMARPLAKISYSAWIVDHFLPKGYPSSVAPDYMDFAKFQVIAMIFATAGGVLSMQSLLVAVGVGNVGQSTLPVAATLNWVMKDGVGQLGGVIFASVVSNRFDANPKRWRMISAFMMDLSSLIEMLTPMFPGYFLPMASVANIGKNIAYLSSSASRAAIHKSFAFRENLADITSKTGSQCILAATIGSGLGICIAGLIGDNYPLSVAAFSLLSIINLLASYRSVSVVTINTLSLPRLDVLLHHQFSNDSKAIKDTCSYVPVLSKFPTPSMLSSRDFSSRDYPISSSGSGLPRLFIGHDFDRVFRSADEFNTAWELFGRASDYILFINHSKEVHLLMVEGCNKEDLLLGLAHAYFVRERLREHQDGKDHKPTEEIIRDTNRALLSWLLSSTDPAKFSMSKKQYDNMDIHSRGDVDEDQYMIIEQQQRKAAARVLYEAVTDSGWVVDELLLETRHARLMIKHAS